MSLLDLSHINHRYIQGGTFAGRRSNQVLFDVSVKLDTRGILALVGESGCGKTTLAKIAADLVIPTEGTVKYDGNDLRRMSKDEYLAYRRSVQLIHQDPYASLNPTRTIADTLAAPLRRHRLARNGREASAKVDDLLTIVGLAPVQDFRHKYPHQLSGGQRQRVSMARAMALDPQIIIADEAVSMVDVSLRVELLDLLLGLQRRLGIAYLFVSHDFAVVRYFAQGQTTAVMYLGHIVEIGPTEEVISHSMHPYTRALIAAVPDAAAGQARLMSELPVRAAETPPTPAAIPGCKFHTRCLYATEICMRQIPPLEELGPGHRVACFHARELIGGTIKQTARSLMSDTLVPETTPAAQAYNGTPNEAENEPASAAPPAART